MRSTLLANVIGLSFLFLFVGCVIDIGFGIFDPKYTDSDGEKFVKCYVVAAGLILCIALICKVLLY